MIIKFCLEIFPFPQKRYYFYKIFPWEKIFIKSPYHKRKKVKKKNIPIHFLQTPHPTPPKEQFLGKTKKISPSCLEKNQTFPSHATQETTLWLNPHPNKFDLSQSLKTKPLFEGVELPHLLLLTQKNPFEKEKENPNPLSLFLKAPFTTCNSFNLIELSTPYTYWNLKLKTNLWKRKKILNSFALLKFLPINPAIPYPTL